MSANGEEKGAEVPELSQVSFDEFEAKSYEVWKEEAIVSLKGGIFEKKLFTSTYEGVKLEPIYTPSHVEGLEQIKSLPGFADYLRSAKASGYVSEPWIIAQACEAKIPKQFNQQVKFELEKGTTGIHEVFDEVTRHGMDADKIACEEIGQGLSLSTLEDANQAFWDIVRENYPLHALAGASNVGILGMLCALQVSNGKSYKEICGCVGADPLGVLVKEGSLLCSLDELYDEMAHTTAWVERHMPARRKTA